MKSDRPRRSLRVSLFAALLMLSACTAFAEEEAEPVKESAETQQTVEQAAKTETTSEVNVETTSEANVETTVETETVEEPAESIAEPSIAEPSIAEPLNTPSTALMPVSLIESTTIQSIEPSIAPAIPSITPLPPGVTIPDVANNKPPAPLAPKPVARGYTGLIVNCKGLGLKSAMSPVIKNVDGLPVYGHKNINPDFVVAYGMVNYADDINSNDTVRAGNNPLVVMAVAVADHNSNPVISVEDANRVIAENQLTGFLDKCLVVLLW